MDDLLPWLLDTDPALRWQVERDLAGAPPETWEATRARVATEGLGARLLALQDPDGQWAGGAYFPHDASREEEGQPWTATTWTLKTLRDWGLDAAALGDTADRLAASCRWEYDDLPYWDGEVDVCINAYTLATGDWLGRDMSALAQWFVDHQLEDGGWNCMWTEGSTRSSVHSTINALFGLLEHEQRTGGTDEGRAARRRGETYLLERRMHHRLSTGEPMGIPGLTEFSYPFRWRFDLMRAADYFRAASLHDGVPPDQRVAVAVDAVRAARQPDGRWLQGQVDAGRVWFDVDVPSGEPSPWLTFVGARILRWWDAQPSID